MPRGIPTATSSEQPSPKAANDIDNPQPRQPGSKGEIADDTSSELATMKRAHIRTLQDDARASKDGSGDDDQITPLTPAQKPTTTSVESRPSLRATSAPAQPDDVDMIDVPGDEFETQEKSNSPSPRVKIEACDDSHQQQTGKARTDDDDTAMCDTDDDARHSVEHIGLKKPPSQDVKTTGSVSVPLRPAQKLKRLREQRDKQLMVDEAVVQPRRAPSADEQARAGLRRALVLVLDHVGFDTATNEVLESFLHMTETYLQSLVEDVARFALAARRTQAIAPDFDTAFARFNLSTGALRPHLRNPVPAGKRTPTFADPTLPILAGSAAASDPELAQQLHLQHVHLQDAQQDLPLLSNDLSGRSDMSARPYIPGGFPSFPSIHTYRNTPIDVDTVTVRGNGMHYADDGSPVLLSGEEDPRDDTAREGIVGTGLGGLMRRDPKHLREAAALEAKQAEEALRSLLRASKIHKLKEVRAASGRNALSRKRYVLWETAMQELIQESKSRSRAAAAMAPGSLREEIADQSMMVNAEKVFHRKAIPRKARKVVQKV